MSTVVSIFSAGIQLVGAAFKWARSCFDAKNTSEMRASASSKELQRSKDAAAAAVAKVKSSADRAAEKANASSDVDIRDALSQESEHNEALDKIRRMISGGNGK